MRHPDDFADGDIALMVAHLELKHTQGENFADQPVKLFWFLHPLPKKHRGIMLDLAFNMLSLTASLHSLKQLAYGGNVMHILSSLLVMLYISCNIFIPSEK